jgi:hypothetical protein
MVTKMKSIKYHIGDFNKFIANFKTIKTGAFTHTSLGEPMGSFYISLEDEKEFLTLYTSAVKLKENLYLTEKHRSTSPILLDFDFRFHISETEINTNTVNRIYNNDHINHIVKTYMNCLNEYYNIDNIKIYLFEKEYPTIKDNLGKDGIHIIIPEIVTRAGAQYIIRENFIKKIGNYFKEIGFCNSVEDIVDKCIIEKNNWLMYGSTKPGCQIYNITEVYQCETDIENNLLNLKNITNIFNLVLDETIDKVAENIKLFSIRNKFKESLVISEKKKIEINNYQNLLYDKLKSKDLLEQVTYKYPKNMNKNIYEDIDFVKKIINVLDVGRANNYDTWIRLGWCLKTIDDRLLDDWIEFSRNSEKYDEGVCEKLWIRMKDTGLGIGTLRMWAKQDNPQGYEELSREDWRKFLLKAVTRTDYDLAIVVFNMFKYDYVCSSIKDNCWYQFRNHRWEQIDSAYTLRRHLSTDVVNEFLKIINDFNRQALDINDDPEEKTALQDKALKYMKVVNELKNTAKKNNIIKECSVMFYYEKFEDKLDSNVYLIGFKNGVYDLELMEFRDGRPDDYISFCTNIDYIPYNENNPYNIPIMTFIRQVMSKSHMCDYLMKCLASFLNGRIKEEKFHIWTGVGGNGKNFAIKRAVRS